MGSFFQRGISVALLCATSFTSSQAYAKDHSKTESESLESSTFEADTHAHRLLFGNGKLFHEIKQLLASQDYPKLGKLLRRTIKKQNKIEEVRQIARELASPFLLTIINGTAQLAAASEDLDVTPGELAETAIFIETMLPQYIKNGVFYIPKQATGLPFTLEYAPKTQDIFIVLGRAQDAFLGKGKCKTVFKSILYSLTTPQIVARSEQQMNNEQEIQVTKQLQGLPGIYQTIAYTEHFIDKKSYFTIYSELYNPGSIQYAIEHHYKFSLFEKLEIAAGLLTGLQSLQSNNIIDKDISARNCLINVEPGEPFRRPIVAVIADFGCAAHCASKFEKEGCKFFSCEVYALGVVLYQLFYEKAGPGRNSSYDSGSSCSCQKLNKKIKRFIKSKKRSLARKIAKGRGTPSDDFELLILLMCDSNPKNRGSVAELIQQIQQISGQV